MCKGGKGRSLISDRPKCKCAQSRLQKRNFGTFLPVNTSKEKIKLQSRLDLNEICFTMYDSTEPADILISVYSTDRIIIRNF